MIDSDESASLYEKVLPRMRISARLHVIRMFLALDSGVGVGVGLIAGRANRRYHRILPVTMLWYDIRTIYETSRVEAWRGVYTYAYRG